MSHKRLTFLFVILSYTFFVSSILIAETYYISPGDDIQTVINSAVAGDLIIVNDGTYILSSQISITKNVTFRSQNGASVTIIDGNNLSRCIYLNNISATVDGFTITNGRNLSGYGGGVQCDNGTVQNCIIENNASRDGGGVALNGSGIVTNCIIRNNTADWGGGVRCFNGTVRGCLITGNTATPHGGGVNIWSGGLVQNCTIVNNTATDGAGIRLWNNGVVENTIIYSNTGSNNYIIDAGHGNSLSYSCTTPLYAGTGNISDDPLFKNQNENDYHLSSISTLINAGLNADWMNTAVDLDGNSRKLDATVDIGAYEYKNVVIGGPIPIASWPVGNPIMYTNPPTFNWYLGTAGTGLTYQIQCVNGSAPWPADDVYETSSTMSFTMPYGLTGGVQYAWRVRSTNGTETSAWSTTEYFTMITNTASGPVVPIASWPVGNPTLYTNPPTLNWYLGTSAAGLTYEIQCVAASAPWPADNEFTTSSILSYTMPISLIGGVQYAWRVRSTNGTDKSAWSSTALFTMVSNTTGGPVVPIASWPVGNPTLYTNPPTLNWYLGTSAAGLTYEIQCVAASAPWPSEDEFATSSILSYSVPSALNEAVQYAWRVRSTNGADKSAWSTTALFTMVSNTAGDPVVPIASWPVANATMYTNPPTLNWYLGASAEGLTYEVQCVPESASWPVDDEFATSSILSYSVPSALNEAVQYAWRVRSTNGSDKSAWSTTALFTMVSNTAGGPVVPIASWPVGNPTMYSNPPTLNWYLGASAAGLTYEIQCVAASASWPVDDEFATSSTTSFTLLDGLISGVQYAWRARSTNGTDKSAWSTTALFTMAAGASPVQPITATPIDYITLNTSSPELFWYLPTAAASQQYELSYSTFSDMSNAVLISNINSLKYQLDNLNSGNTYYWTVRSIKSDGSTSIASQKGAFKIGMVTDVNDSKKLDIPKIFNMSQNYPNPFNPVTTISYSLPFDSKVVITVYNVLGQEVRLLKNEIVSAGNYEVQFNSLNLSSGLYFYTIQANALDGSKNFSEVKKMILMK